jgi:phage terminase large subunit
MNRHGYPRIIRADKGAGSVEEGVKFLQNYIEIVIHPRCVHVHEEFLGYRYKVHPLTGEVMPILEDKKNHTIDSVRYAIEQLRKAQGVLW